MGENIEEYKRYMNRQEMLGVETFRFEIDKEKDEVWIVGYIPNNESKRMIKIPDFVSRVCGYLSATGILQEPFNEVNQSIVLTGGKRLKAVELNGYEAETLEINRLDTSKVENMGRMFERCTNLKELNLSNFNTGNVIIMNDMFGTCKKLEKIELSSFNTSKVESMFAMFNRCYKLRELDLSSFDTSSVINMGCMFNGCIKLEKLDLSTFDTERIQYMENMFYSCDNLRLIMTNKRTKQWLEKNREAIKLRNECEIIVK